MKIELEAGNIPPGSLVWREDWEAWLPVEKVFPQNRAQTANSNKALASTAKSKLFSIVTIWRLILQNRFALIGAVLLGILLLAVVFVTLYSLT
jgi:hypothetical protein